MKLLLQLTLGTLIAIFCVSCLLRPIFIPPDNSRDGAVDVFQGFDAATSDQGPRLDVPVFDVPGPDGSGVDTGPDILDTGAMPADDVIDAADASDVSDASDDASNNTMDADR